MTDYSDKTKPSEPAKGTTLKYADGTSIGQWDVIRDRHGNHLVTDGYGLINNMGNFANAEGLADAQPLSFVEQLPDTWR